MTATHSGTAPSVAVDKLRTATAGRRNCVPRRRKGHDRFAKALPARGPLVDDAFGAAHAARQTEGITQFMPAVAGRLWRARSTHQQLLPKPARSSSVIGGAKV